MAVIKHLKFIIIIIISLTKVTNGGLSWIRCKIIAIVNNFILCKEYEIEDEKTIKALFDEMGVNPDFKKVDDMVLSPEQYDVLYSDPDSRKNGYKITTRHWNDATVPYQLDGNYSNKLINSKNSFYTYL